jgi:hypothetical protein
MQARDGILVFDGLVLSLADALEVASSRLSMPRKIPIQPDLSIRSSNSRSLTMSMEAWVSHHLSRPASSLSRSLAHFRFTSRLSSQNQTTFGASATRAAARPRRGRPCSACRLPHRPIAAATPFPPPPHHGIDVPERLLDPIGNMRAAGNDRNAQRTIAVRQRIGVAGEA